MHELSLCDAIVDRVLAHADGRQVHAVRLRIGHFRQVVPDSLRFYWDLRTAEETGTAELAGSQLEIESVPAVVRCRDCGAETTLEHPILLCGSCDRADVELVTGEEFLIESIDLAAATQ